MESYSTATIRETITWLLPFLLSLLSFFLLREQLTYLRKKSHLPGPTLVLPFVGTVFSLVGDPTTYWFQQARYAKSAPLGLSANYIIGRFIVFIRSSDLTHRVFANVRPDAFNFVGHPFGKKLFGEHNMIYLSGQPHKDIRRRIAPNFTPKALATYAEIQQRVILKHLFSWERLSHNPVKLRPLLRDMNLETSQTVFAGPYLDQTARDRFSSDYNVFNLGTMTLPIDLPGFAFWKARKAVARLSAVLASCAAESKARMAAGIEPACLTDYWMQDAVCEEREAAAAGGAVSPPLPSCSEVGGHMFDFLFAAQDASTSSLLWAVALLDSHPEVLAKVRAEVAVIWSPDSGKFITVDQLSSMKYTQAVTREVLRYRAPATMVPHIAGEDFPITETYTIPKGTIVFPSVFESSFQGFPEPDRFDPDRFIDAREEDVVYKRNYLVFGAGSHQCVGQRYAVNLLVLFIAVFTAVIDFKRHRTEGCDEIVYTPTISPKDGCTVFISRRVAQHPNFK